MKMCGYTEDSFAKSLLYLYMGSSNPTQNFRPAGKVLYHFMGRVYKENVIPNTVKVNVHYMSKYHLYLVFSEILPLDHLFYKSKHYGHSE